MENFKDPRERQKPRIGLVHSLGKLPPELTVTKMVEVTNTELVGVWLPLVEFKAGVVLGRG